VIEEAQSSSRRSSRKPRVEPQIVTRAFPLTLHGIAAGKRQGGGSYPMAASAAEELEVPRAIGTAAAADDGLKFPPVEGPRLRIPKNAGLKRPSWYETICAIRAARAADEHKKPGN